MSIRIEEESFDLLEEYATVPIAFLVRSLFRVDVPDAGLGGLRLIEEPVASPWTKDYDTDERPLRWRKRWDLSNWVMLSAYDGEERAGGAIVARKTPGVNFLDGRTDLAALWDIRVAPARRGSGVGAALVERAVTWSRSHGCLQLKIETQNINVPACRFYAAMGSRLSAINLHAYSDLPDEVQLIWYLDLPRL